MFNALSFQIVLGSPMLLYAKGLGASATILGVIAGMMPLLVIFQIPAAQYVAVIGYKRFVYGGWGVRVMFIFAIALVPLASTFLNDANRLALILILLFAFNLSRGISSAGWLPWISSIVPPSIRGTYLARDAAAVNFASFLTLGLAGWCLGSHPTPGRFFALFLFSGAMGAISLRFLKKIPEVEVPHEIRTSGAPVPWMEMIRYEPFRKLLRMVVAWSLAYGGITAFSVTFLKVSARMPEGEILLVNSLSFLGGLTSLWIIGAHLDALGSKPVLSFSFIIWALICMAWGAIAAHLVPPSLPLIIGLQLLMGLFAALVSMSNTRLAMATVPVMGRNHFFAIFSVLANVTLGLAPILWGLVIDGIGPTEVHWAGLDWNRYSIFFIASAAGMLLTLLLAGRLIEPQAARMDALLREILLHSPQRILLRFWPKE